MTNPEKIEFIDEFLSELEDVLHGIEGRDCTKSRKYLEELKQAINYSQCCESDSELLPKRLSNEAYKKAQIMSYTGFVEWWDEQQV